MTPPAEIAGAVTTPGGQPAEPAAAFVGLTVRASRRALGMTAAELARRAGIPRTAVTAVEGAFGTVTAVDRHALLMACGIADPLVRDHLVQARRGPYFDDAPGFLERFAACLAAADHVRLYAPMVFPPGLWCAPYARVMTEEGQVPADAGEAAVLLERADGRPLTLVLNDLVLWGMYREEYRPAVVAQIDFLLHLVDTGRIALRVVPRDRPPLTGQPVAELTGRTYRLHVQPTLIGVSYEPLSDRVAGVLDRAHDAALPGDGRTALVGARERYVSSAPLPEPFPSPPPRRRTSRESPVTSTDISSNSTNGGQFHGPVVQAGDISGGVHFTQLARPHMPLPRQLPAPFGLWVDRETDLAWLRETSTGAEGEVRCVAICGPGGVGKTALALRFLRARVPCVPEAQFYLDLGGHPGGIPVPAEDVLGRFLRALGFGLDSGLPSDVEERAALWRSATADRPVTVLADNAGSPDQVRPLIPGGRGSLVVVTSRTPLTGLVVDGADVRELGSLPRSAAVDLLTRRAGSGRSPGELAAAERISDTCAGMPLALVTTAARAATLPGLTLRQIAECLTPASPGDAHHHAAGPGGDTDGQEAAVAMSVERAYDALTHELQDVYVRLAASHADVFDGNTVAAVCAVDLAEGSRVLAALRNAELLADIRTDEEVERGIGSICQFPDPVAAHARRTAREVLTGAEHLALARRRVQWYLHAATRAETRLTPSHRTLARADLPPGLPAPFAADAAEKVAVEWLRRWWPEIRSAIRTAYDAGWWDLAWQMVDASWPVFLRLRYAEDWITVHQDYGLPAARGAGDEAAVRRMLTTLAAGYRNIGRSRRAVRCYEEALLSARLARDPHDEAHALYGIGATYHHVEAPGDAVAPLRKACASYERLGNRRGAGLARILLGDIASGYGDAEDALPLLEEARADMVAVAATYEAARALAYWGRALARVGSDDQAEDLLRRAEAEFAALGGGHWQARVIEFCGEAHDDRGQVEEARVAYTAAYARYAALNSTADMNRLTERLRLAGEDPAAT